MPPRNQQPLQGPPKRAKRAAPPPPKTTNEAAGDTNPAFYTPFALAPNTEPANGSLVRSMEHQNFPAEWHRNVIVNRNDETPIDVEDVNVSGGDAEGEKKKKKVVKLVKKVVKKRVPLRKDGALMDCAAQNSGFAALLTAQEKESDRFVDDMVEESGKFESLVSIPVEVEGSRESGSLVSSPVVVEDNGVGQASVVEEAHSYWWAGVSAEAENSEAMSACGVRDKDSVVAGDDGDMGSGGIALSGELEAMERRKRKQTEIFVGGLHLSAKEQDVRKVFEEVGEVVDVRLVINFKTGKNRGFAFVPLL